MCGIAGARSEATTIDRSVVEQLNREQAARGPDHAIVVESGRFLLGNTRLAVQDPTPEGNQPFSDPTGRFTAVFNGEIYNFHELVRDHGLEVTGGSDGAIIPVLWARHGPSCLSLFRGMYAIAIADTQSGELFLARDPFGIKPLHWRSYEGGVLYASDPKPLWRVDRTLPVSQEALTRYLRFGAVAADDTPFDGIHAVAPGECLRFDGGARPKVVDRRAAIEQDPAPVDGTLADAFRESVRMHLVSDVPTALLLSAGVDSSLVALAARELGRQLHCLTVTGPFGGDESPQASATAREYGHTHEVVAAALDDHTIDSFFAAMQRPTIDGLNSFLVSRAVRSAGFKVALSGLGGDEALGGYAYSALLPALPVLRVADRLPGDPVLQAMRMGQRRRRGGAPSESGKIERLAGRGGPRTASSLVDLQRELLSHGRVSALLGARVPPAPAPLATEGGYRAMAVAELDRYLRPMLLADADTFSMASSVELRVPFVDVPFFNRALARRRLRGKTQLVHEMGDPYLRLLARRPKSGFSVPMLEWIRGGPLQALTDRTLSTDAPLWSHVDAEVARPMLLQASETSRWSEPWSLVALDSWLRSLG